MSSNSLRKSNSILQKTTPNLTHKIIDTLSVIDNQRMIVNLAKSNKFLFINPVPLRKKGGGNIEHYFHFIFDLVLPLYLVIKRAPPNVVFLLKDFGIYTNRLLDIFPNRIKISIGSQIPENVKRIKLFGMNPNWVNLNTVDLVNLKKYICRNFNIDQDSRPNKIILIERLLPKPYFMTEATLKGGGALRRSIVNHPDLASAIKSIVKHPYEFHNLQLENLSLTEQIQYCDQALVIIAQHGAGLANIIWMKQKSIVIELRADDSRDFFQSICEVMSHNYLLYKTDAKHATIDIDNFSEWILSNDVLKGFFGEIDQE